MKVVALLILFSAIGGPAKAQSAVSTQSGSLFPPKAGALPTQIIDLAPGKGATAERGMAARVLIKSWSYDPQTADHKAGPAEPVRGGVFPDEGTFALEPPRPDSLTEEFVNTMLGMRLGGERRLVSDKFGVVIEFTLLAVAATKAELEASLSNKKAEVPSPLKKPKLGERPITLAEAGRSPETTTIEIKDILVGSGDAAVPHGAAIVKQKESVYNSLKEGVVPYERQSSISVIPINALPELAGTKVGGRRQIIRSNSWSKTIREYEILAVGSTVQELASQAKDLYKSDASKGADSNGIDRAKLLAQARGENKSEASPSSPSPNSARDSSNAANVSKLEKIKELAAIDPHSNSRLTVFALTIGQALPPFAKDSDAEEIKKESPMVILDIHKNEEWQTEEVSLELNGNFYKKTAWFICAELIGGRVEAVTFSNGASRDKDPLISLISSKWGNPKIIEIDPDNAFMDWSSGDVYVNADVHCAHIDGYVGGGSGILGALAMAGSHSPYDSWGVLAKVYSPRFSEILKRQSKVAEEKARREASKPGI